jgi:WD40 repeat protein
VESDGTGIVRVWDAATGQEQRRFEAPPPAPDRVVWVETVAVSPDGRVLAAQGGTRSTEGVGSSGRRSIWLWDLPTGRILRRLDDQAGHSTNTMAFSPHGTLASVSEGRPILFWDVESGREWLKPSNVRARALAFLADGQRVVYWAGSDSFAQVINPVTGGRGSGQFAQLPRGEVHIAVFTPDGTRLALGGQFRREFQPMYGFVKVFDTNTGREVGQVKRLPRPVIVVAISTDGRTLATALAGENSPISVWDVESGNELKQFRGLPGQATWLAFAADGRRLFSASTDTTVLVWDTSDLRPAMD